MLRTRVITALIGIPVLLFFVYLGDYWFALFILLIAMLGLREYNALMHIGNWKPFELMGYLTVPILFVPVHLDNPSLILSLLALFFIVYNLLPVFFHFKVKYWECALAFWGIIYTGGLAAFLLAIRMLPEGIYYILLLLIVIWFNDIFAYLFGSRFGRRPLAPTISPKKTIEGTIAGLTASVLAGLLLGYFFPTAALNAGIGARLGMIAGVAGSLGDLSQSALKRSAGVKDSGDLLPGHGGVLDRFDSLFFTAPFFYIYLRYFIL